jgi:hypothetical protein
MTYFAAFHWGWLFGAGLIGLAMGWISVVQRGEGLSKDAAWKVAVFVGGLVLLSLFKLLPGRAGYWLDLALVMFAVYLIGCAAGSWLRYQVVSRITPSA